MGGISERAGVDLDYVTTLVDIGVLVPDGEGTVTEGDARRARLYHGLERTGLPLQAIRADPPETGFYLKLCSSGGWDSNPQPTD